ncbi:MAG: hypothetical protein COZ80_00260 [Ignavibacteria bacterium CG_4_8_14_3_um_filter_37_9]|nr:MAG: hypothetical protein COZ80_00260 [Ignavibacteria bacterium CG_4_8_14_3_um_filter_37_9]
MKKFLVKLKIYKYSRLKYIEEEIFFAKSRIEAKQIAISFIASTEWAFDLTSIPDLRTIKQI